jgi:hypothetical protein
VSGPSLPNECHDRAGLVIAQADDTTDLTPPSIASHAECDAQIVDGRLDLAALAGGVLGRGDQRGG